MRLVTFSDGDGERVGALRSPTQLVDLGQVAAASGRHDHAYHSLVTLLARPDGLAATRELLETVADRDGPWLLDARRVRHHAPLPRPGKILGVALNYRDFCTRAELPLPTAPKLFAKLSTTVTGPEGAVQVPQGLRVTYEGELAVVIGRRAHHLSADEALGAVAGYTVLNDFTASDHVRKDVQLLRGKNLDTFCPMGPALVTGDEIPDPDRLAISTDVNGVERQRSDTSQMVFGVGRLIEYLSSFCTLEPGDVIATGTPAGTAAQHTPAAFVQDGDTVSVTVETVGTLTSRIVAAPG